MTFSASKYRGETLGDDIRSFIEDCRRDAVALAARVRAGKAGYGARGRAEALRRVAGWLERIVGNSVMLVDLATNINDCMLCLQQSAQDEACEANPVRRRHQKQQDPGVQHRTCARARGRASAYADAQEVLSHLLKSHYPGKEFPLTLTAGNMSYDEWLELLVECGDPSSADESGFEAFSPLPEGISLYEQELLSQVEAALLKPQERLLVQIEPGWDNALLAMRCVDRLLRGAPGRRVLVLMGYAALKPDIIEAFQKATSPVDGSRLIDLYSSQERLLSQLESSTQVCFSTLREVQALLPRRSDGEEQNDPCEESPIAPDAFDIILVYGETREPAQHMWKRVLGYFQAPYRIGVTSVPDPFLLSLFEGNMVCSEARGQAVDEHGEPQLSAQDGSTAGDAYPYRSERAGLALWAGRGAVDLSKLLHSEDMCDLKQLMAT